MAGFLISHQPARSILRRRSPRARSRRWSRRSSRCTHGRLASAAGEPVPVEAVVEAVSAVPGSDEGGVAADQAGRLARRTSRAAPGK
jgi:hypothetical protein